MLVLLTTTFLVSSLWQPGLGATEAENTRGLLYLLKYGYLAPRNGTSALLTPEALQADFPHLSVIAGPGY